jgi:hypothetical protein
MSRRLTSTPLTLAQRHCKAGPEKRWHEQLGVPDTRSYNQSATQQQTLQLSLFKSKGGELIAARQRRDPQRHRVLTASVQRRNYAGQRRGALDGQSVQEPPQNSSTSVSLAWCTMMPLGWETPNSTKHIHENTHTKMRNDRLINILCNSVSVARLAVEAQHRPKRAC